MTKAPLTCQSTKVCIVIRKNMSIPKKKIEEYCKAYFKWYAFIEHKGDIEPKTGIIEGTHYHIVGDYLTTRVRFSTRLEEIVKFFRFDNNNGLEIDKYQSMILSVQYLIHKNQPNKTQHDKKEIVSNLEPNELETLLIADSGVLIDYDYIEALCLSNSTIRGVIKALGFNVYHKYRSAIKDIYEEIKEERSRYN